MTAQAQRPVMVLDFDRVLFDTNAYIGGLWESVRKFGVTKDVWEASYHDRGKDGVLRMDDHAARLAAAVGRPAKQLQEAFDQETADSSWYLYPDTKKFLEEFRPRCLMYLLTFGERAFQTKKIDGTDIRHYFHQVAIVDEPKESASSLPITQINQSFFLNDNVKEMLELARVYRWGQHIHINRYGTPLPADFHFPSFGTLPEAGAYIGRLLDSKAARVDADSVAD